MVRPAERSLDGEAGRGARPTDAARGPLRRKIKILVLTSTFPRWRGDSEPRFVLDLCRHLAADAEVLVIAPHAPAAARAEVIEGVQVRRFRYFLPSLQAIAYAGGIKARLAESRWRLLQLPLFFLSLWLATRRSIRAWAPDVVHAHWIIPQGVVACLAGRRGLPILCTSHGGDLHGLRGAWFDAIKAWTLRRCAAVTVVSESMTRPVLALAPEATVRVIPMGTDLQKTFVPPAAVEPRDLRRIVFAGRLVEKKGVTFLLRAFASLADDHPDLALSIAGDGPLKSALEREAFELGIAGRVAFLGALEQRDLAALYRTAGLAVFPFIVGRDGDQEGFGLVVVEAMGCGCPVIASDLPAVRHSIEPGVTGLLVPPGDAEALAAAIRTALRSPDLRARLAAAALAAARERFDWPSIAAEYRRTIDSLIDERSVAAS